ncbi:MAG: RluA family pseudouridine synthase [Rhodospirillaceae bacterium]
MSASEKSAIVPADAAGARLDKWLAGALPDLSRSRLKALIEDGAVSAGGKVLRDPAHKVAAGQTIRVAVPAPIAALPEAQEMDLVVVYEDEHLIVVDKPAGLVVHPAAGNLDHTLVNALLAHCGPSLAGIGGVKRPGIVHRIDKDTSGLLVVAKTERTHVGLTAQFSAHTVERRYDALVWGVPRPAHGTITGNIGRNPHNRKKMAVVRRGGKTAETYYDTVANFGTVAAHVQCHLKTGRTHQIRVHMTSKGHPLIGDPVYGRGRNIGIAPQEVRDFDRQALHASTLGFIHPITGKELSFESELPDDMCALMEALDRSR